MLYSLFEGLEIINSMRINHMWSYVSVRYLYVTCMLLVCTRMLLIVPVCSFSHDPFEWRKTKTKVIALTDHNSRRQSNEPIRARSKHNVAGAKRSKMPAGKSRLVSILQCYLITRGLCFNSVKFYGILFYGIFIHCHCCWYINQRATNRETVFNEILIL